MQQELFQVVIKDHQPHHGCTIDLDRRYWFSIDPDFFCCLDAFEAIPSGSTRTFQDPLRPDIFIRSAHNFR